MRRISQPRTPRSLCASAIHWIPEHCTQALLGAVCISLLLTTGCESGFHRIDRKVDAMVQQTSAALGPDAYPPATSMPASADVHVTLSSSAASEHPATLNPSAGELPYRAVEEANDVLSRLNSYAEIPAGAMPLDLPTSLALAEKSSREYKFAEESYLLAALRLLVERHLWGPRFFNDTSVLATGSGDNGLYDTSLQLVNEFRVTQRLPYGGEISARALANATEDLHRRVAGENVQDATLILQADLPLLRGSGLAARDSRISAERELIYAARDFEQFRRDFFFDIAQDFLNLIVLKSSVDNAERQWQGLDLVAARERALYEAGRSPLFQKALAEQSAVAALDDLNTRREAFRLAVDRFKVRLNIDVDKPVRIVNSGYDLPQPQIDIDRAVQLAMAYRLDLQTQRDRVEDASRAVEVARNAVLPDLNLTGSAAMPTDPRKDRGGLDFSPGDSNFTAGITFGLPLDREAERANVRSAQIGLERARREFERQRDDATVSVRSAARDIDRARFTLDLQQQSVATGEQRVASIEAAPDRATARDASEANNALAQARDRRDAAARDLQVAILRFLLETGQLRVDDNGQLLPLRGMEVKLVGGIGNEEAAPATMPAAPAPAPPPPPP